MPSGSRVQRVPSALTHLPHFEPSFVSAAEATQGTIDYKGPAKFAAELRESFEENAKLIRSLGITKK